jgi:hypothetical protein
MPMIYDAEGHELGAISLTDKQEAALATGESIAVLYHTPQLMRGELGDRSGSFTLRKDGERLVTSTPASAKECVNLQRAIAAVKMQGAI